MRRHYLSYADWSWREYVSVVSCLLRGQIYRGPNPAVLAAALSLMYAPSTVYLANFAHHAISIALGVCMREQPARTEVIVPAYVCPSVIQAVLTCGLKVRTVEVLDDLNIDPFAVEQAISTETLAVIAPHMYGCPAKISEIEAVCTQRGVFLIDDAAQVVGVESNGRLLGTFGDFGVISFAQSKTIVTGIRGAGGVLIVNKPKFTEQIGEIFNALPVANQRVWPFVDFLWNYIGSFVTGNSGYYFGRIFSKISRSELKITPATHISNFEAGIALVQLQRLDEIKCDKLRISNAYFQALKKYPHIQFPQFAPDRFLARVMLSLPVGVDVDLFRTIVKNKGVETRAGYQSQRTAAIDSKSLSHIEQRLIGVPVRAGMSVEQIEEICTVVGGISRSVKLN